MGRLPLTIALMILLGGCVNQTTVPLKIPSFPKPPEILMRDTPELMTIERYLEQKNK